MCTLEDRPEDVARVNAIIYQDVLGLEADFRQSVESRLLADFQQLKAEGLTSSLFNLATDPAESKNLAPEQPDKVRELTVKLDQFAEEAVPPILKPEQEVRQSC